MIFFQRIACCQKLERNYFGFLAYKKQNKRGKTVQNI